MSEPTQKLEFVYLMELLAPMKDGRYLHQGWSPKCEEISSTEDDLWGVLKTTAIQDGKFLPQYNKKLPFFLEPRPHLEVYQGDILLTCAGPRIRCGIPCLVRETRPRLMISGKMYRMRVLEPLINSRFIEAMLRAPETQKAIDSMKTGISESGMNLTHERFAQLTIPLAPTNEQKRIADKLDAVLARVDACRERLDRVPSILKRFRQAVLTAATSGKLTEEWRANRIAGMQPQAESGGGVRESAAVYFIREKNQIDASWNAGTLETLLEGKPRNGYSPRAVDKITSVRTLTLTATTSGKFSKDHFKYIDENIPIDSFLWLQPNDILIQRANTLEYVGTAVMYEGPPNAFIYPDLMMKARANAKVIPPYLLYILQSEKVRSHFRENATGTAGNMPKINQQTVLAAPVCWPSIEEQTEIVRRVETLFAYADRLEARYTAARAQVEKLTPALLAKAFRGELVPQDPNDEPASVLLARIRAARAEAQQTPKPRKLAARRTPPETQALAMVAETKAVYGRRKKRGK